MSVNAYFPKRIVCLSHDSVETLLALDAKRAIVGRPAGCRNDALGHLATVGGYGNIDPDKVLALKPDLVIGYSDFHHKIVAELVAAHVTVLAQNHTDVDGIFQSILMLGGIVGRAIQAMSLVQALDKTVSQISNKRRRRGRPRVYFEEWPEPLTCGTRWISQIVEAAGGDDIFRERARRPGFRDRAVSSDEVIDLDPDIIVGSWCGRKLDKEAVAARPGWDGIAAIRAGRIFELKGAEILQPGPRVVEGLQRLHHLFTVHFEEAR